MTSIPALPPVRFAAPVARSLGAAASPAAGRFMVTDLARDAAAGAAYPIARAAPPLGLQGILITPRDEQEVRDDQGRHRARRMLAGLTRLQLHLLSDTAGMDGATDATLADLRAELHDLPTPLHPELTTVLASITLRVEVELARRATD